MRGSGDDLSSSSAATCHEAKRQPPHEAALPAAIAEALHDALGRRGLAGRACPLAADRLVADAAGKYVVLDRAARPIAFVAVSPERFPDAVAGAVAGARAAIRALGTELSGVVSLPWLDARSEGRSWSIADYRKPVVTGRWHRRWNGWRLAPAVYGWLSAASRRTRRTAGGESLARVENSLLRVRESEAPPALRDAAQRALDDLRSGAWRPCTVLAHNDLWSGNLLWQEDASTFGKPRYCIIDWGAARLDGMPVYDAVRLAMSFALAPRAFAPQLARLMASIEAPPAAARHYLVAALGELLEDLGEWPVERFWQTANACDDYLASVLPRLVPKALGPAPVS